MRRTAIYSWLALALAACSDGGDAQVATADPGGDEGAGADLGAAPEDAGGPEELASLDVAAMCAAGEGFEKGDVLGDLVFPRCDGQGTMNLRDLCGAKVGWIRSFYGW